MRSHFLFLFVCAAGVSMAQSVKINEVESNGGTPGDWVEIYNPGPSPVNLGGYVFKDNDDTHAYTIPAGTMIAPGAYLVLDELISGVGNFNFGLGAADSARLFDANLVLVDSYTWTSHAVTTYGRCPNGSGGFLTTTSSTKGAANDCGVPVKINEIESSGGTPGDWVELYNPSLISADIGGFVFKDNDDTHTYTIPAGTTLAPGAYLVLDELISGVGDFNFGLGSGDSARLFDTSSVLVDSYTWTSHASTTYGRCPNGTGAFTTTASSTKGAANDCGGGPAVSVKINEIESSGGSPGDWVELYNPGPAIANVGGFVFKDNDDTHSYTIPAGHDRGRRLSGA